MYASIFALISATLSATELYFAWKRHRRDEQSLPPPQASGRKPPR
jgi:hypothetical protein